jgi:hypothetical protein
MGGSSTKEVAVNQVNSIVATVFTSIALTCSNTALSQQAIVVGCSPQLDNPDLEVAQPYENQPQCTICMDNIVADRIQYYNLQRTAWAAGAPVNVALPIDQDYNAVVQAFIACGQSSCKACSYTNLSESTVIKNILSCEAFNNIRNNISQSLTQQVTQSLTNNQDFLAPLATMLGASSFQQIVNNVVTRIQTKITQDVVEGVANTISNNQILILNNGDAQGLTQQSAFNCAVNYFSQTQIFNSIFTDEQWQQLQDLANDQNTIDSVGNAVVKAISDMEKFSKSTVGIIVIFILSLVGVVFVVLVLYVLIRYIRTKVEQSRAKSTTV